MNGDGDHDDDQDYDDLETRLRAWRPAEVPWGLNVRLRAVDPTRTPAARRFGAWLRLGAGAAVAVLALALVRWSVAPVEEKPAPAVTPSVVAAWHGAGQPLRRDAFAENLVMNIHTGVRPDFLLVAQRLDGDGPVEEIPAPFGLGAISAKVDCQF